MKATFDTKQATYIHKIGWFTKEEIPHTTLKVTIEFLPEEKTAITRLGIHENNLIDRDNLLFNKTMTNQDSKLYGTDWYPQQILEHRYRHQTHQTLVKYFFDGPMHLTYRNLAHAENAIEKIKEQLVTIKRRIEAPAPDKTFEI